MLTDGVFTEEDREGWINFCVEISEEIGDPAPRSVFEAMTDTQLDKEADWYYELSGK